MLQSVDTRALMGVWDGMAIQALQAFLIVLGRAATAVSAQLCEEGWHGERLIGCGRFRGRFRTMRATSDCGSMEDA